MDFIGTDMKFVATSTGAFSLNDNEWQMVFYVGDAKVTMTKKNVEGGGYELSCDAENMGFKPLSDGRWVFLLDTSFFPQGRLCAILSADIPDADFDPTGDFETLDGVRREVRRYSLDTIAAL